MTIYFGYIFIITLSLCRNAKRSSRISTPKDYGEDEIFMGPVGFRETCISKVIENTANHNPQVLSPLSTDQMFELFMEAQKVAADIAASTSVEASTNESKKTCFSESKCQPSKRENRSVTAKSQDAVNPYQTRGRKRSMLLVDIDSPSAKKRAVSVYAERSPEKEHAKLVDIEGEQVTLVDIELPSNKKLDVESSSKSKQTLLANKRGSLVIKQSVESSVTKEKEVNFQNKTTEAEEFLTKQPKKASGLQPLRRSSSLRRPNNNVSRLF